METMGFETKNRDAETYEALGDAFLGEVIKSGQAYADQKMLADINERIVKMELEDVERLKNAKPSDDSEIQ